MQIPAEPPERFILILTGCTISLMVIGGWWLIRWLLMHLGLSGWGLEYLAFLAGAEWQSFMEPVFRRWRRR